MSNVYINVKTCGMLDFTDQYKVDSTRDLHNSGMVYNDFCPGMPWHSMESVPSSNLNFSFKVTVVCSFCLFDFKI